MPVSIITTPNLTIYFVDIYNFIVVDGNKGYMIFRKQIFNAP